MIYRAPFLCTFVTMIRLAILASANGTNAQAIIEAVRAGKLEADVKVVLTNKEDAGVIERARKLGVPVEIVPSKGFLWLQRPDNRHDSQQRDEHRKRCFQWL